MIQSDAAEIAKKKKNVFKLHSKNLQAYPLEITSFKN